MKQATITVGGKPFTGMGRTDGEAFRSACQLIRDSHGQSIQIVIRPAGKVAAK